MSLRLARQLSIIGAISLFIVIVFAADWAVRYGAGFLFLAGAVPWWKTITRAAGDKGADEALSVVKRHLRRRNL